MNYLSILLVFLVLGGAGCNIVKTPTTTSSTATIIDLSEDALQGSWKMTSFQKGKMIAQNVSEYQWRLRLEEGVISGKFCNTVGGNYGFIDGVLVADELVSTLMYCEGLPSEVEDALTKDLAAGLKAAITNDTLILSDGVLRRSYTFKREK